MIAPKIRLAILAALICAAPARAQLAEENLAARIKVLDRDVVVAADGSAMITAHAKIQVLNDSVIPALSQTPLSFNDVLQTLDVTEAYNRKADGRVLKVAPEEIVLRANPASGRSPILTDRMQKVIHYPDVQVGDTLVYSTVLHFRPLLPGSFLFTALFPSGAAVDESALSISLPAAMPVTLEARGFEARKSLEGDRVVYHVQYANPAPAAEASMQGEFDRAPRIVVSSFKDYDALARACAALALPATAVTPAIQSQADAITAGMGDRYEQARMLYDWVSSHTRTTPSEFGESRVAPQSGDSVLANSYGDSEDHAALLAALLKAKGIASNLALVNSAASYTISGAAGLQPFNRVILWLPEFKLYADPTSNGFVSFGQLPRGEYGKPAIHLADPTGAVHRIPPADGRNSSDKYTLTIRVDDFGHAESESSTTASGDFAPIVRLLGAAVQGENGKKLALAILQKSSMPHATGAFMAPPPVPDEAAYSISATYAAPEALVPLLAGTDFRLGDILQLVRPISANFYGAILDPRYRQVEPVTCFSGRSSDEETLEFPAARHLAKLPDDSSVRTAHVSYTAHWSQTATSVTVRREFEAHFDQPLCNAQIRDEVQAAYVRILQDSAAAIVAVPRNAAAPAPVAGVKMP